MEASYAGANGCHNRKDARRPVTELSNMLVELEARQEAVARQNNKRAAAGGGGEEPKEAQHEEAALCNLKIARSPRIQPSRKTAAPNRGTSNHRQGESICPENRRGRSVASHNNLLRDRFGKKVTGVNRGITGSITIGQIPLPRGQRVASDSY